MAFTLGFSGMSFSDEALLVLIINFYSSGIPSDANGDLMYS